jgi:hypothetical protein
MGAPMRYQPQGLARLSRSNPLVKGAQAIVSAAQQTNLASQKALATVGTVNRGLAPTGKVVQFRKNGYLETESLPAIGTASFIEFWYGYVSTDQGNQGNGSHDPSFVTGSSNNSVALVTRIGDDRTGTVNWGALYQWPSNFNSAGEVLTPGSLQLLVAVRRQDRMELWRNGVLVASITQTPVSISATTFTAGAFVEATYWTVSNDTILAGRVVGDWSADQVREFSANPSQIFDAGSSSSAYQAAIASTGAAPTSVTASIAWTEANDGTTIASTLTDRSSLAWTEADDLYAVLATETDREILGWSEPDDAWALVANETDRITIGWTEASDSHALSGTVGNAQPTSIGAALTWVEVDDSVSLGVALRNRAGIAWTEQDDGDVLVLHADTPPQLHVSWHFNVMRRPTAPIIHFSN